MSALVASLLCAALASAGAAAPVSSDRVSPLCRNGFYLVPEKELIRFEEPTLDRASMASLRHNVNALAFAEGEELLYGIAEIGGASHVVTLDSKGKVTDRGAAPDQINGAYAGTAEGQKWIVHNGHGVVTVDLPSLSVSSSVQLPKGFDVGDWDLYGGMLYGIATGSVARLLRIDPQTGESATVAQLPSLPGSSSYGAAVVDFYGTLHALHNASGKLYHVPLADPQRLTVTDVGLKAFHADAARCPMAYDTVEAPDARHTITTFGELTLGQLPDLAIAAESAAFTLKVPLRNTTGRDAQLVGWHDLDHDGQFAPADRATVVVPPQAQEAVLSWPTVAVGTGSDVSRLRLRLFGFPPANALPEGFAAGGEAEDYPIRITWPMPRPADPVPAPSPSATPSALPAPVRMVFAAQPPPTPADPPDKRLPLTLSLFAGMLVPAITVAARGGGRRGAA